ncbi:MAG: DUF4336 domain-containing protein [Limnohabitans sp.]|nr:MAG: DUF4336 domain-containing protein [Limnohabitans sp.]
MSRLIPLGPEIWSITWSFKINTIPVSTRMTVVRLESKKLWLHSPIPLDAGLRAELLALGEVSAIVAPNKVHHLFLASCAAAFPNAVVYGAPGLIEKLPELPIQCALTHRPPLDWEAQLDQVFIEGIPFANETLWFHRLSNTLIVTDLVQFWSGDLAWQARLYAQLTGVRKRVNIPYTVRCLVRDRKAVRRSVERILEWPFQRIVMAHNAVIESDAQAQMHQALASFLR